MNAIDSLSQLANSILPQLRLLDRELDTKLAAFEGSPKRVISIRESRKRLVSLSLAQEELFAEAFTCLEQGLSRAAIVLSWAAFMEYVHSLLESESFSPKVRAVRKNWSDCRDFRGFTDHQVLEAAGEVSLLNKNEVRITHGWLSQRHECAHPGRRSPDTNAGLGFVANLLGRIEDLEKRAPTVLSRVSSLNS